MIDPIMMDWIQQLRFISAPNPNNPDVRSLRCTWWNPHQAEGSDEGHRESNVSSVTFEDDSDGRNVRSGSEGGGSGSAGGGSSSAGGGSGAGLDSEVRIMRLLLMLPSLRLIIMLDLVFCPPNPDIRCIPAQHFILYSLASDWTMRMFW